MIFWRKQKAADMKLQQGSSLYSLEKFKEEGIRTRFNESWDYGRKHGLPLWCEYASKQHYLPGCSYVHYHPSLTALEMPLQGELLIECDERIIRVKPGEIYLLPAEQYNSLRPVSGKDCWKFAAGFCGNLLAPFLAELGFTGKNNLLKPKNPELIAKLLETLMNLLHNQKEEEVPKIVGLATQLLMELKPESPILPPPVTDALRLFEFNLSKPIRIREVAGELHIPELTLTRLFKEYLGKTPGEQLRSMRMQKAKALLCNSPLSITEISEAVGYSSSRCFARKFRSSYGTSPLQYRQTAQSTVKRRQKDDA